MKLFTEEKYLFCSPFSHKLIQERQSYNVLFRAAAVPRFPHGVKADGYDITYMCLFLGMKKCNQTERPTYLCLSNMALGTTPMWTLT